MSSNYCSKAWEVRNNKSYIISFLTGLGGKPLDTSTTLLLHRPGFYFFGPRGHLIEPSRSVLPSVQKKLLPPLQPLFRYFSSNWGNCCCCCCWWNIAISAAPTSFTNLLLKLTLNCCKPATSRSSNCCCKAWEVRNNKSYIISFLTVLGGNPLDTSTTLLSLRRDFYFVSKLLYPRDQIMNFLPEIFLFLKISASWDHRMCCLLLLACSGDALYCVAQLIRLIGAHYHYHQHQGTLAQRPEKGGEWGLCAP